MMVFRGKGSKGKKIVDDSQETIEVSEESKPELEPARKKTSSKRRVKKKVTLSVDDNIIPDDPDAALELAKSISKTEGEESEAVNKVHATHARIVTEHVLRSARRRKSGKVTSDPPKKVENAPSLTLEEQEAVDIMQALKESKKTSRRQPGTRGSNKGTGSKPGVPYESTVVSTTSREETSIKPGVPDEEKDITEENDDKDGDADDEGDDHISDTQDADDEDVKTKSDKDDIYKYKIFVRKDEDEEMSNAEVDDSDKGDEEVTDAAKADAEKTSEVKDDAKKTELPPSSSSVSVSSEVKIQSKVPHTQSPFMLNVLVFVISEPTVLTPVQESPLIATVTSLPPPSISTTPPIPQQTTTPIPTPPTITDAQIITTVVSKSDALSVVQLRVAKLEKDMYELKKIDLSTEALVALKTQVRSVVDNYLGSKKQTPTVDLEQGYEKSASEILKIKREQVEKQQTPKFTIKTTYKETLEEYDLKSALYQSMHANKSFNRNPANHRLYHALMEALIEDENAIDKGVADTLKDHKRKHYDDEDDDDEDPSAGPNQGKKTKKRRTKEFKSSKKPSSTKETPKGKALSKGPKMQPPRPPTPDPEWNKRQVVTFLKWKSSVLALGLVQDVYFLPNKLDWGNPEGDHYSFDLSKPLPLQDPPEVTYTTSITKTKAARYEIKGIEDMQNAYSTKAILGLKSVSVKKLHGHCHLEEIMVKRSDQQFYKFKEGEFVDLHLKDIEDMLLLAVQHKLFHLY
ncbi:hypothetical protein Tco_1386140 [Tanacetum coccineum]